MKLFDRYTWRQKNQFLWIGSVVFLILIYQLSIKPTIRLQQDYRAMERNRANMETEHIALAQLRAAVEERTGLSLPFGKGQRPENEELARLTAEAGAHVVALSAPLQFSEGGLDVTVTASSYSGTFHELLSLLHYVEQHSYIQLINAVFRAESNTPSQQPVLFLELNTYIISTPIRDEE